MADSDAEDEKFANNVMNELAAFQVTEKPAAVKAEEAKSLEASQESKPDEVPAASSDSDPPKPPPRVIKLSRPVNPYVSARTSQGVCTSVSSASTSSSTPATGSTAPVLGGPGSRLAALQRPGSPMQKFLQRSKSPALAAAAARLGQQTSSEQTNNHTTPNSQADASAVVRNKETANTTDNEPVSQAASLRSTMPPRIQSSGLTSSILLRRPQSPLRTSRAPLLSKQSSENSLEDDPSSPRSPQSDNLNSPTLISEESRNAEKAAIRNKLRANSFRLKDLLTKRPFVKSRDRGDSETKDGSESDQSTESGEGQTGTSSDGTRPRDRTRWRAESSSGNVSHRSRLAERTSSILSSRTIYGRSRNTQSADAESENKTAAVDNSQSIGRGVNNINDTDSHQGNANSNNEIPKPVTTSSELNSPDKDTVTIGATLLRSPRTRVVSVDSSVPSNSDNLPSEIEIQNSDDTNCAKPDILVDQSDKQSKSIAELEKANEVNLVFDSENIEVTNPSPENEVSHDTRQSDMSMSMYAVSQSHTRASSRPRVASEPATPITEQNPLTNSQSYEKSLDGDFLSGSPSLKRSFAVTDLDKAMQERDKHKLSMIFKESSQDQGEDSKEKNEMDKIAGGHNQLETDLDDRHTPAHRLCHSPRIQHKLGRSLEEWQSQPTSPPINPVAPMVYKPNVNLEDAVKWPMDIPGKLDFKTMEVFEGQMLLNWLTNSVDKSHYLRLVMTKHDMNVIACQICTCLLAAGVLKQLESKDAENVFKTDCMYYWTHTQQPTSHAPQDVNKLTPMWPPTQEEDSETKSALKYTEADHQTAMVKLRHEYNEEVGKLQTENKGVLDKARDEYETRLQQAMERIVLLQKEVEKYKCLAGIEKLTQDALLDANAARLEAGLQPDGPQTNGFVTPMSSTPSISQYHTPAATPDGIASQYPINVEKSPAELFTDLTTPVELRQDGSETSRSETSSVVSETDSVPPPAPPPPPGVPPPPAPPLPPAFGVHRSVSIKPVVNPSTPMKPLFWQRLQLMQLKTPKHTEYNEAKLLWEDVREEVFDIKELDELFSKTNIEPSRRFSNKPKSKTKQPAKVISPKRSQTIGILLSSLRVDMSDIEYAILNFDTSLIGEEKLRHIYDNRGDPDEMKKLKEYVKKHPDTPLDKPDQFLYDLSQVPDYIERIFCFIFREAFQESISVIENKMTNLKMTCQTLMTSSSLKRILGLVLALGNYMNGGSKQRGQADGFGIEILPKLKDVKSRDNSTSLLHYTVQQYVKKYEKQDAGTDRVKLPLPDPSDMSQACLVNYDELEKELKRIKKDFEAAEEKAEKVISAAKEHHHLQPFKDIMTIFFERGRQEFKEQEENIMEGKKIFKEAVLVFCVKPKSGDKEVTPEYFFSTWCTFCKDFKDIWKREQQKVVKLRIRENEIRVKKMQESLAKKPVRTRTRKPGGLKDRLAKQGLLES